ncbi:LuxR family transcriptional regulator [Microtetraspora sp. NBRC 16547]|uniref:LuxR family transcriptional regulator n=1 Tax=Microtetraspora sp. NBRC 16547 TaxID=3030993 RepID=UPI0024A5865C|nr:LuxR family transcriptional regulator [Microtetraspora sp. NBRC 16547]GLX00254.1 helix-turn-helix transcriptional regulator [Microtetraspora sp. NBRC 16547]
MLHGRDGERRTVDRLLQEARTGTSGVLLIRGEPGIGKSALLDHAATTADGFTVLRGAGVESEAELPFAGLHLLLLPVLDHVEGLPPVQAAALRGALGMADGPAADRFLVGVATLSLLAEAAGQRPLLCLVDDMQWLDKASADALLFAARRLRAEGVVLLLAAREEFAPAGLPELPLSGLEDRAAAALLDEHVPGLAGEARERVLAEAGGNPLALIELPVTADQAHSPLGPLPLTRRLQDAFYDKVAGLPDGARTLLLVASAEDTGEVALILRAARRFGVDDDALEVCEQAGLVRVIGTTLVFRHSLARSAVYQAAGFARRCAVHRVLAEVGDAERRVWHLVAAATEPDERLAADLESSAERFRDRTGHAAAAAALERAAELTPDESARTRRLAAAAQAALDSGQLERGRLLAEQVAARTADPRLSAEMAMVRADVEFERGALEAASAMLMAAAESVVATDPAPARTMLLQVIRNSWYAGDPMPAADATARLGGLPYDNDPRRPAPAMAQGMSALLAGRPAVALPLLREVVEGGRQVRQGMHGLRNNAAQMALLIGDHSTALDIARSLSEECASLGMITWLPHVHLVLAAAELHLGRHLDAIATAASGESIATQTGQSHLEAQLCGVRAWLSAAAGDESSCRELAGRAGSLPYGAAWAQWALALLDLGLGRYDQALDRLDSVTRHQAAAVPDQVEAAVRLGLPHRAERSLALFEEWTAAADQPWARAALMRCHALLSDDEESFIRALAMHERPFDRARTQLLYGEWLRRERRKHDARTPLRDAAETFERLGARPWAERACGELRATGETLTRAPGSDLLGRLTPQELQVVRLAATGATNKEIAAQLFLSPRTVGHHLYKVYPKLGVTTRTELAGLSLP